MSLTAKRPRGGYSENNSQHNGFIGFMRTRAESPLLIEAGFYSFIAPVLLSILAMIYSNLQAMWEVWQSTIGV